MGGACLISRMEFEMPPRRGAPRATFSEGELLMGERH